MNASVKTKKDSSPDKSGFGMTNKYDIRLTANFYLSEFTTSQEAERNGYRNEPNEKQIENLRLLCVNVIQPLREIIKVPIFISSGFRSSIVNAAVGGRFNSQHLEGQAADFTVPGMNLKEVFELIPKHFSFDQLIYEFGKWIHVSWNSERNRNEVLISKKVYGVTKYEKIT
ncbi:MAG: D-Ala-D-Ala carboxypeptidase family metallohydrolase [Ignavibacteria bacterium]|nr:D-Ala-D-Ala carboxypeptidase family metallohydrolase [Ignavibacteria bacterium]